METTEDARRQYKNLIEEAVALYRLGPSLEMMAELCWQKAEHIRLNWQDPKSADAWDKAARTLQMASAKPAIEEVSK